jgi:hypothetical protein
METAKVMPAFAAPTPRFIPLPEPIIRSIRQRSTRVGLVVFGLSLVIAPALALWPLSLVPSGEPFRIGVVLFAGLTGLSVFAAGAFTLGARACVSTGYLKLNDMRITRAGLIGSLVLSGMTAPVAWGVFALAIIRFDAVALLYVLLLAASFALSLACFIAPL